MRKLVWFLAVLMTLGIGLHYLNDQSAIDSCLDKSGSYNFKTDFCSFKETYQGSTSFVVNHLAFFFSWIFSIVLAALSLFLGIIKSENETPEKSKAEDKGAAKRLLMIDNYDSFTYNLVQYFGEIGLELEQDSKGKKGLEIIVKRNDEITIPDIERLNPDLIVISPGPCAPDESGLSMEVITYFGKGVPVFGVCLGHQAMAQVFGGEVIKAEKVMHGKTSDIYHTGEGVFKDLPNPFKATRYHSLIVKTDTLPDVFEITAWTEDENGNLEYIMGIRHKEYPMEGVQFHPESILSEHGHALLARFVAQT